MYVRIPSLHYFTELITQVVQVFLTILGQVGIVVKELEIKLYNWYITNDATFEITGVQLDLSHPLVATPFEHLQLW